MQYSVIISLITNTPNEINKFLSTYFEQEVKIDENTFKWSCIYRKPLESISLISAIIDNEEKFNIETLICMDPTVTIRLNNRNINDVIKFMYERYS
jgi:hypothetical protein